MVDALGYRKKIGIVVPSTNTIVGPECEALRPRGVTNHVARLTIKERPIQASEQAFWRMSKPCARASAPPSIRS